MAEKVVEIVKGVVEELKQIARTDTVVGQPIQVGGQTIIPVIRITVGFGAGGGGGEGEGGEASKGSGFGGGGGGGARVEPAAFILVSEEGVRLLPAQKGSFEGIVESIPAIVGSLAKEVRGALKGRKNPPPDIPPGIEADAG